MAEEKKYKVPDPPEHVGALADVPEDVQAKWKKAYAEAYESAGGTEGVDESTAKALGLREANRLIRVKEPKSYEDAVAVPDWQVMKREELSYKDLPVHAQREVKSAGGSKSGTYLRLYTTDGKEHFFAVPPQKADTDEGSKKGKGKKGDEAAA